MTALWALLLRDIRLAMRVGGGEVRVVLVRGGGRTGALGENGVLDLF